MRASSLALLLTTGAAIAVPPTEPAEGAESYAGPVVHEVVLVRSQLECERYEFSEYAGGPTRTAWRHCYAGAVTEWGSGGPGASLTLVVSERDPAAVARLAVAERLCLRKDSLPFHRDDDGQLVYHLFHSNVPWHHVVEVECPEPRS